MLKRLIYDDDDYWPDWEKAVKESVSGRSWGLSFLNMGHNIATEKMEKGWRRLKKEAV